MHIDRLFQGASISESHQQKDSERNLSAFKPFHLIIIETGQGFNVVIRSELAEKQYSHQISIVYDSLVFKYLLPR